MTQSQKNIQIQNRQDANKLLWKSDEWQFFRLLFLLHPANKGGCVVCGNIPNTVEHPHYQYYGTPDYMNFWKAGCVPHCSQCNQAVARKQLILCPRCRQQGHYCPPGEVCYTCTPKEVIEHNIWKKEHRQRERNESHRKAYRKFHPKKKVVNGVWTIVKEEKT